jgi:hypothetical protein
MLDFSLTEEQKALRKHEWGWMRPTDDFPGDRIPAEKGYFKDRRSDRANSPVSSAGDVLVLVSIVGAVGLPRGGCPYPRTVLINARGRGIDDFRLKGRNGKHLSIF